MEKIVTFIIDLVHFFELHLRTILILLGLGDLISLFLGIKFKFWLPFYVITGILGAIAVLFLFLFITKQMNFH